ncbi:MAG: hypothetical protein ACWA6X_05415 [Bauldia sp.]
MERIPDLVEGLSVILYDRGELSIHAKLVHERGIWIGICDPETAVYCATEPGEQLGGYLDAVYERAGFEPLRSDRPRFRVGQPVRTADAEFIAWFALMYGSWLPADLAGQLVRVRAVVPQSHCFLGQVRYDLEDDLGIWPEELLRPAE